jgi:hypothetical protein
MKLTPEISIIAVQDDLQVRGNAIASGDPKYDQEVENEILERLEQGDIWAWAAIEVRAECRGLSASAYLGACCYQSEDDFKNAGDYYPDLVTEATTELADLVKDLQGVEIEIL